MNQNIVKRKDNRSLSQFKKDLGKWAKIENCWAQIIEAHLSNIYAEVKLISKENEGKLSGKAPRTCDLEYTIGKKKLKLELKTIPKSCSFMTFKIDSLELCAKNKSYLAVPTEDHLIIVTHKGIAEISKFKAEIFPSFSPNNKAVRIYSGTIKKMEQNKTILKYKWSPKALKLIDKNKELLWPK